jgi:crotonobetainyl-CoA:carnitine CoA-transferase CaiB-like acyl-CoA transferase
LARCAALRQAGIAAGAINGVAEALADPQAAAREMVLTAEHPTAGRLPLLGFPFDMSLTPPRLRRPPPRLGEHTGAILREELGLDPARIAALHARGACWSGE